MPAVLTDPARTIGEPRRFPLRRLAFAIAIAALSDVLSLFLETLPPAQWILDFTTAGGLFLVLGRNWLLLPGLVAEALPVTAIFPTWILVVVAIALWGRIRR